MWCISLFSVLVYGVVCAQSALIQKRVNSSDPWVLERFSSLVTFGDSYTDENRLNYFIQHNGSAPPPGTLLPEVRLIDMWLLSWKNPLTNL